jgi:hypothetical protein
MPTKKSKSKIVVAKKKVAMKKKNNNIAKISINLPEDKETVQRKLTALAHSGTKDALEKISEFIIKTEDKDLRGFAQCAYDEAEFFYYSPENESQEKELLVAKMLKFHNDKLRKLLNRVDSARYELRELEIEREIDKKIFKSAHRSEKGWGYEEPSRFSEDYCMIVRNKLTEIEADIEYESAWIKEAEKMIKTEKFKNLPDDFFDHMHFDGEGGIFWTDEMGMDYDEPKIEHDPLCDCGDDCDCDENKIGEDGIDEAPF